MNDGASAMATKGIPIPLTLYPYQVEDIARAVATPCAVFNHGLGAGKTVVALTTAATLLNGGLIDVALVIAPKTVMKLTWEAEILKHFPSSDPNRARVVGSGGSALTFVTISGDVSPAKRHKLWESHGRIILANPAMLTSKSDRAQMEHLVNTKRVALFVDEAHNLANYETNTHEALMEIGKLCHRRYAMTATPIMKDPGDLYGLLRVAGWQMAYNYRAYLERFCTVKKFRVPAPSTYRGYIEVVKPTGFQPKVIPWLTGYLRERVITRPPSELPVGLTVMDIGIELSPSERAAYKAVKVPEVEVFESRAGYPGGAEAAGAAAEALLRGAFSDHSELRAIISGKRASGVPAKDARLVAMLPELLRGGSALDNDGGDTDEKVVVFSPYRETIERLAGALGRAYPERTFVLLTGAQTLGQRQAAADALRDDPKVAALLMTNAGAEGLNLQERASRVVLFDRLYVPAREDQIVGRVYRSGQVRNCVCVRFVVVETLDERLLKVLAGRSRLAAQVGVMMGGAA